MSKEKKFINLPGQPFYRYDESFKKKVLNDISQGFSEVLILHKELKLLRQELVSEKLCSEALLTIIEEAELDLQIPIQKKPLPRQLKK